MKQVVENYNENSDEPQPSNTLWKRLSNSNQTINMEKKTQTTKTSNTLKSEFFFFLKSE